MGPQWAGTAVTEGYVRSRRWGDLSRLCDKMAHLHCVLVITKSAVEWQ